MDHSRGEFYLLSKHNFHVCRGKEELGRRRKETHSTVCQDLFSTDSLLHQNFVSDGQIICAVAGSYAIMPKIMFCQFISVCVFTAQSRKEVCHVQPWFYSTGIQDFCKDVTRKNSL